MGVDTGKTKPPAAGRLAGGLTIPDMLEGAVQDTWVMGSFLFAAVLRASVL